MNVMIERYGFMPTLAHENDAGYDLRSPVDREVPNKGSSVFDTGVHVQIPNGYCGLIFPRSGMNVKSGIDCVGVIDPGYTGTIVVKLYNHSYKRYQVKRGDRIAQLVIVPKFTPDLKQVDAFETTERGNNGFGSTGR